MSKGARIAMLTLFLAVSVLPVWQPPARVAAQQGPTNLLVNGGFESWDWNAPGWPFQNGIPEVQVCPGWHAYYVDKPPDGVTAPEYWKRPEFRDVKTAEFAYRVHSGFLAQKYFTFGGQHMAGLYQQVGGIAPGTPLRFSIYMQTWGCMAGEGDWNVCPTGVLSNNPAPMHTRVGIDPYGGTNAWSPNVVWSGEMEAYDAWTRFQVDAVAQAGTVTVFTYSYADWFDYVFRISNDVYIDDGSLIALDEQPAEPPSPEPTLTEPPTDGGSAADGGGAADGGSAADDGSAWDGGGDRGSRTDRDPGSDRDARGHADRAARRGRRLRGAGGRHVGRASRPNTGSRWSRSWS